MQQLNWLKQKDENGAEYESLEFGRCDEDLMEDLQFISTSAAQTEQPRPVVALKTTSKPAFKRPANFSNVHPQSLNFWPKVWTERIVEPQEDRTSWADSSQRRPMFQADSAVHADLPPKYSLLNAIIAEQSRFHWQLTRFCRALNLDLPLMLGYPSDMPFDTLERQLFLENRLTLEVFQFKNSSLYLHPTPSVTPSPTDDSQVDVFSADFDPEKALYGKTKNCCLSKPYKDMKMYDFKVFKANPSLGYTSKSFQ